MNTARLTQSLVNANATVPLSDKTIRIEQLATNEEVENRFSELLKRQKSVKERTSFWSIYQVKQHYAIVFAEKRSSEFGEFDESEILEYYYTGDTWKFGTKSGETPPSTSEAWKKLWHELHKMGLTKEFCLNQESQQLSNNSNNNVTNTNTVSANVTNINSNNNNNTNNNQNNNFAITTELIDILTLKKLSSDNALDIMRRSTREYPQGISLWVLGKTETNYALEVQTAKRCTSARGGWSWDGLEQYVYSEKGWQNVKNLKKFDTQIPLSALSPAQLSEIWTKLEEDGYQERSRAYPVVVGHKSSKQLTDIYTERDITIKQRSVEEAQQELSELATKLEMKVGQTIWSINESKLFPGSLLVASGTINENRKLSFEVVILGYIDNQWCLQTSTVATSATKTLDYWQDLWSLLDRLGFKKNDCVNSRIYIFENLLIEKMTTSQVTARVGSSTTTQEKIWYIRESTSLPGTFVVHECQPNANVWDAPYMVGYINNRWEIRSESTTSTPANTKEYWESLFSLLATQGLTRNNCLNSIEFAQDVLIERMDSKRANEEFQRNRNLFYQAKTGTIAWFMRKSMSHPGAYVIHSSKKDGLNWTEETPPFVISLVNGQWNKSLPTGEQSAIKTNDIWEYLWSFLEEQGYKKPLCVNRRMTYQPLLDLDNNNVEDLDSDDEVDADEFTVSNAHVSTSYSSAFFNSADQVKTSAATTVNEHNDQAAMQSAAAVQKPAEVPAKAKTSAQTASASMAQTLFNQNPAKEEAKPKKLSEDDIPQHFIDPISFQVMQDPVICILEDGGYAYERGEAIKYMRASKKTPTEGVLLEGQTPEKTLKPNTQLKQAIAQFKEEHPYLFAETAPKLK